MTDTPKPKTDQILDLLESGGIREALTRTSQWLAAGPDNIEHHKCRGLALAYNKDYKAAIPFLEKALIASPDDLFSKRFLATCYWRSSHYQTAERLFLETDEADPKPTARDKMTLAQFYFDWRYLNTALTYAESAVELAKRQEARQPETLPRLLATIRSALRTYPIDEIKPKPAFPEP